MIKSSSNGGSIYTVVAIVMTASLMAFLGFICWRNIADRNNIGGSDFSTIKDSFNTEDWLTYENDEIPFIFDHPKDWLIIKEDVGVFSLSDSANRKIISIKYVKMPRGLARGVSACQVKKENTDKYCSYIDNELVGYFFGRTEDNAWMGILKEQNANITLTLISKDQTNKSMLMGVVKSVRLKS